MKTKFLTLFLLISGISIAQTGGNNAFPFLNLAYDARSAALGNDFITGYGDELNMGIKNPSLLNSRMNKDLSVNQALFAGGINYGMFNYGFNVSEEATMATYIKYVSYGTFERTSVNGLSEGEFSPIEMIAGAGYGHTLNERLSVGANANIIYSQLETYNSLGASIDLAGTIKDEDKGYMVTAMVKNFGYQFTTYLRNNNRAQLPVELQLAGSYKLAHAPFRLSILAHNLNRWDITYNDPNLQPTIDPLTGDSIPVQRAGFFEKLGHHFTYQVEVLVTKNIHLRTAFDYHLRKELALESRPGASGFSFGIGLNFSKFSLDYGFAMYSRSGFNNILTLSSNLSKWRK